MSRNVFKIEITSNSKLLWDSTYAISAQDVITQGIQCHFAEYQFTMHKNNTQQNKHVKTYLLHIIGTLNYSIFDKKNLQFDKLDTGWTTGKLLVSWSSILLPDDDDRSPFNFLFWLLNVQYNNM